MKKKFKLKALSVLMAILMVATIIPIGAISSFAVTSGDYDYSVISETNKTAEITGYNGAGGDITIPSKIDGYTVTGISRTAFVHCAGLKSVTIPDSITNIDFSDVQFFDCTDLTAIIVSEGNTAYSSVDGVIYSKDKKQLFICPEGKSGEVTIPTGVTSIGIGAFYGCTNLTSITIPNGVTSINSQLFSGCTGLKGVTIPNGVTIIDDFAFNDCTNLTSITIPNSVTSIGSAAFFNCTSLKDIIIPNSVISIGAGAFAGCTGVTSINVSENNTKYSSIDGIVYSKDKTELLIYPNGRSGEFIIPNSVTSIGIGAFAGCTSLIGVTIPDSVTGIGDYAFNGCTGLKSVIIPDSVTSISNYAFEGCTDFTILASKGSEAKKYAIYNGFNFIAILHAENFYYKVISEADKTIEIVKFTGTGTEVLIPDTIDGYIISSIATNAFANNVALKGKKGSAAEKYATDNGLNFIDVDIIHAENFDYKVISEADKTIEIVKYVGTGGDVTIPSTIGGYTVISLGFAAFENCNNITSLIIPDSVTSLSLSVFYRCAGLKSVILGNGITSISQQAFYDCTSLTSIVIPNSVTSIEPNAFAGCTSLKSVTIGNSVTNIGIGAFSSCKGLTNITIPDSVTNIGDRAFFACTSLKGVTIPNSVITIGVRAFGYYMGNADYEKTPNFSITGSKGSAAEKYATDNGFKFIDIDAPQEDVIFHVENFDYKVISEAEKTIEIVKFTGTGTEILIPDTINGYTVAKITDGIFPKDFTLKGKKGSLAETYATANGLNFIDVDALPVPTRMLGDVNGDGKVTAADAILALRAEAKLKTLSPEEFTAADVTKDGKVTAADAIKILRFEAKLITAF